MSSKRNRKRFDHSGSTFDSFLEEEGILEEVEAVAIKRVLAWQLEQEMKRQQKTKQAMAKQLRTSRSQLDRLLDPRNVSVSLDTTKAPVGEQLGLKDSQIKKLVYKYIGVEGGYLAPGPGATVLAAEVSPKDSA